MLEAYRVFVNNRNAPVLSVLAFIGPAKLTRCEFLYKLEVSCRVNRRYHVRWLIKTSFGPAYEIDIDASNPSYYYDAFRLRFAGGTRA